jgi:dihydroorotate dehydrogenase (NAD+) catalytic subunit
MDANDALEFLMAGAVAVQVGTASFVDPGATGKIVDGLEDFIKDNGYDSVEQLIGKARQ